MSNRFFPSEQIIQKPEPQQPLRKGLMKSFLFANPQELLVVGEA